ncbi:hypothetical protein COLO4_08569 [Corchorus olitorius]|uniref:Uncharacterized protein n=1 Tax=Corchorus olitorius TaxID=93759 RepID=A0A1R3KFG6_9ROSI|nr:hypothetical protein COLO4_08569 [Corchorus olitorius]
MKSSMNFLAKARHPPPCEANCNSEFRDSGEFESQPPHILSDFSLSDPSNLISFLKHPFLFTKPKSQATNLYVPRIEGNKRSPGENQQRNGALGNVKSFPSLVFPIVQFAQRMPGYFEESREVSRKCEESAREKWWERGSVEGKNSGEWERREWGDCREWGVSLSFFCAFLLSWGGRPCFRIRREGVKTVENGPREWVVLERSRERVRLWRVENPVYGVVEGIRMAEDKWAGQFNLGKSILLPCSCLFLSCFDAYLRFWSFENCEATARAPAIAAVRLEDFSNAEAFESVKGSAIDPGFKEKDLSDLEVEILPVCQVLRKEAHSREEISPKLSHPTKEAMFLFFF